jgi:hypothetical protein
VRIKLETARRELQVEDCDSGHRLPVLSESAELDSTSGRGLRLIDTLCESWGVREELNGKTVWARLRW